MHVAGAVGIWGCIEGEGAHVVALAAAPAPALSQSDRGEVLAAACHLRVSGSGECRVGIHMIHGLGLGLRLRFRPVDVRYHHAALVFMATESRDSSMARSLGTHYINP